MTSSLRLIWAFLRRDFEIASSYRAYFFFSVANSVVTLAVFYFLSKTIGTSTAFAQKYGSDYFSFALIGVAIGGCLRTLQSSFSLKLREAQVDGSLEALLASPLSTSGVIGHLALYPAWVGLFRSTLLVTAGKFIFGAHLQLNGRSLALSVLGSVSVFAALGLISAAFVLIFKRADPFNYALDGAAYLLSGMVYPIEVLPPFLQTVSRCLPTTYAVSALRAAALHDANLASLWKPLLMLALFSLGLWPLAVLGLNFARRQAEQSGSLPHA